MVILYTGTPGSGKSYHATEVVHSCTRKKINVIANFIVKLPVKQSEKFFYKSTSKINVDFLVDFAQKNHVPNKESQTVVFIDEASILFNSRDFNRGDRMQWLKFFSQHRKMGYDVILITQMDRSLDRQIRGVIEYQYIFRKLKNFGLKGFVIRLLTHKQFVCIHQWYTIKERLGAEYFRIRKSIANTYDTYSMFNEEG